METGTASFRFVTLAVLATLGWSLWVTCTDSMASDGMDANIMVDAFHDAPAVMDVDASVMVGADCLMGDPNCCTMTEPFLSLGKYSATPDLAAIAVPVSGLLIAELFRFHQSGWANGESPPGIADPTYITISVLRI
jgi:hypothetical protein